MKMSDKTGFMGLPEPRQEMSEPDLTELLIRETDDTSGQDKNSQVS